MQQHPPTALTFPHTRNNWLLRALGALIACIGGLVAYSSMQSAALFALIVGLSSVVGARLWRTWWALLGVLAALWLGAVAADALYRAPDRLLSGAEVVIALDLLVVAALPAAVGAAIGAAAGMRLERRPSQ